MTCAICGDKVEPEIFGSAAGEEYRSGSWIHSDPEINESADHHAIPESPSPRP